MPDITVTPELASIIKRERTNITPRLSAKDLSKDIGKSETYISTLERGNIKKIDEDTFIQIFKKIKNVSEKEFNKYLENIFKDGLANRELTDEELDKQKWMYQLNYIIRKIPIPQSVVDYINNLLNELQKTAIDLTNKINENTYCKNKENYEDNQLYVSNNGGWSYKFNLSTDVITKILSRETKSTNYITMLGIIYIMFLLKGEDDNTASEYAIEFLQKHQFYDLDEIIKARHQHSEKETNISSSDFSFELPKYELEFDQSLKNIDNYIQKQRNININSTYSLIRAIEENLTQYNDRGFTNAIYSLPFGRLLKDCSNEKKHEFLDSLLELIKNTIKSNDDSIKINTTQD